MQLHLTDHARVRLQERAPRHAFFPERYLYDDCYIAKLHNIPVHGSKEIWDDQYKLMLVIARKSPQCWIVVTVIDNKLIKQRRRKKRNG